MPYVCRGRITAIKSDKAGVKIQVKSNVQWDPQKMGGPKGYSILNIFWDQPAPSSPTTAQPQAAASPQPATPSQPNFISIVFDKEIEVDKSVVPFVLQVTASEEEFEFEIENPTNPKLTSLTILRK